MSDRVEYTFRPDVRLVIRDADTVELRTGVWNPVSTVLADDDRKGMLAEIVTGIWRGESQSDLAGRIGASAAEIGDVVESLLAGELLVSANGSNEDGYMPYLAGRTLGIDRMNRTPPDRALVLAPEHLLDVFTRVLVPRDRERVSPAPSAAAAELASRDLFLEADAIAAVDALRPYEAWKDTLVVVLWPELHPILLSNLNRIAHVVGFPFMSAVIDGPFAILGPTVVPFVTGCFACAETRVIDAMRDHTLYAEYREALASGRVHASLPGSIDPFQGTLAALAAWEATNFLYMGTSFTTGKLLTVYAHTMELMFHDLVRVPRCRVCGAAAGLDAPLYTDLQAYLTANVGEV